jgi:hypothetical protein
MGNVWIGMGRSKNDTMKRSEPKDKRLRKRWIHDDSTVIIRTLTGIKSTLGCCIFDLTS